MPLKDQYKDQRIEVSIGEAKKQKSGKASRFNREAKGKSDKGSKEPKVLKSLRFQVTYLLADGSELPIRMPVTTPPIEEEVTARPIAAEVRHIDVAKGATPR